MVYRIYNTDVYSKYPSNSSSNLSAKKKEVPRLQGERGVFSLTITTDLEETNVANLF